MQDFLSSLALIANYLLVPGIAYGCQLALGALGVTLVFGILRFSNFAHGETMAFGAMVTIGLTYWFQSMGIGFGLFPTALLALPFSILVTALFCLGSDRLIYRYYRQKKSSPIILLIVSIGLMFFMNGLIRFFIGPNDRQFRDGERFILKAREFKQATGLSEGITIKKTSAQLLGFPHWGKFAINPPDKMGWFYGFIFR